MVLDEQVVLLVVGQELKMSRPKNGCALRYARGGAHTSEFGYANSITPRWCSHALARAIAELASYSPDYTLYLV